MTIESEPVRIALVGFGWWGRTMARTLAGNRHLSIVRVIEPSADGRAAAEAMDLAVDASVEPALADPTIEAVVICAPHKTHAELIERAAVAGKHVFCEKPFCTSGEEARRALAAISRAQRVVGIGHERRFEPAVQGLAQRVKKGDLGTPLVIEANFSQDKFLALPPDNWRLSARDAPVGPLSATGIHLMDLSIMLLGRPVEVLARFRTLATGFANGDTLTVSLGFASGAMASLTAVLATPFAGRLAFYGSKGWVEIRDRRHPEDPAGWDVITQMANSAAETAFVEPAPIVRYNLEAFARAVRGIAPYPVSTDEIQTNVDTFEAIVQSAESGKPVTLG